MRVLIVTPFVPDPAGSHGGAVYLGTYLAELAQRAEVTLVCLASPGDPPLPAALRASLQNAHLVPHHHLRDVTGAARWRHRARTLSRWAGGLPLVAAKHASTALAHELREVATATAPDVVVLEQAVLAQYLPVVQRWTTVLVDHERGDPLPGAIGPGDLGSRRDARLWRGYVTRFYPAATLLQALNQDDASHLESRVGRPVETRPLVVPMPDATVSPDRAARRALFLGNYLHTPNLEAAQRLVAEAWPIVRAAVPDAELCFAGAHPERLDPGIAKAPGVRVAGHVPDLVAAFADARLLWAPLFTGGGVRVKLLTAMAHGLPVVSNRLGLRGLDGADQAVACAEDAEGLAQAAITWLEDGAAAADAGRRARTWAETHVSATALVESQLARYAALKTR